MKDEIERALLGCWKRFFMIVAVALSAGDLTLHADEKDASPPPFVRIEAPKTDDVVRPLTEAEMALGYLKINHNLSWSNTKNRLDGPIRITFDLGKPYHLQKARLVCLSSRWRSFTAARIEVANSVDEWTCITEQKGPGSAVTDKTSNRNDPHELLASLNSAYRYVRAVIKPTGWYTLQIDSFEISRALSTSVSDGVKTLKKDSAFYAPDGPFREEWAAAGHWLESAKGLNGAGGFPPEAGPGAYVKAYFHNQSDMPMRIDGLTINGVSLDKHLHRQPKEGDGVYKSSIWIDPKEDSPDFQTLVNAGDPIWYKVEPNPVPPGQCTEVTLRLRQHLASAIDLGIDTSMGGRIVDVAPRTPAVDIEFAGFDNGLREMVVYARRLAPDSGLVSRVLLDGEDCTESVTVYQPGWLEREDERKPLYALQIALDKPLERGSFHRVSLVTETGRGFTTQIRAFANPFAIGMFGAYGPSDDFFDRLKRYRFNSTIWFERDEDLHEQHGLYAFCGSGSTTPRSGSWCLAYYQLDEPDVKDYGTKSIKDYWRRLGSTAHYCIATRNRWNRENPAVPGLLQIDSTFKPLNLAVYAQIADLPATDPYAPRAGNPPFGLHHVSARLQVLAAHSEPKPIHATLHCCKDEKNAFVRYPAAEEVSLMVSYALMQGAKGISYYWWRGVGGLGGNPDLLRDMGKINARIEQIGRLASLSVPTGWASSPDTNVLLECLWAAGEGMVLIACNEDYDSIAAAETADEGFETRPRKNVTVECTLPPGTEKWRVCEVTPLAWKPLPQHSTSLEKSASGRVTAKWTIDELKTDRWFVIVP
ncbi:MAG: hypothetical protein K9N51_00385 [Candidatus Pacebacteria bacterium]|nr:hypothetical protein [Candidatus Paceibacterota bacterium]